MPALGPRFRRCSSLRLQGLGARCFHGFHLPGGWLGRAYNTEGHIFKQMQERSQACVRVEEFQLRLLASSAFSILKRA